MSFERNEDIFVIIESGGCVAHLSAAAERSLTAQHLTEIADVVLDVETNGDSREATQKTIELGTLEIVPMSGDDGANFLVSVRPITDGALADLTPRQREVALLAAGGSSVDEIAWDLEISANTVKYHLKQVYKRLDVSSRLELAEALD